MRSRVQQADAHGRAYGVTGVPTLVVDGRYKIDGRMAGNNANMLAIGARVVGEGLALAIVAAFLDATFEGGRHGTRVDMISALET